MSELSGLVAGDVLEPGDPGFDEASHVWNARFRSTPDLVLRCSSSDDVAAGVRFAVLRSMPVTVRGGGHDYAGRSACDSGLLLDLSPMHGVEIDSTRKRARVGGGATWGQVDVEAQANGLATPSPTVSTVGIGGSTLGGGEGWLTRKYGLALDNLRSAEVVTASGDIVVASPEEHPDLFWAIRGGGGNFGAVTTFEFELHDVGPDILAGQIIYPSTEAEELLRAYREFFSDAPDEATCYLFFLRIPPIADFPEEFHGQIAVDFAVSYAGAPSEGERVLAPLRGLGEPILDSVGVVPYVTLQRSFDAALPPGNRWYSRAHYLDGLPEAAIGDFLSHLEPLPGAFTTAYFGAGGGAPARVAPSATAFPHRRSPFSMHILPGWSTPSEDEAAMSWARRLHDAMRPYASGVYVNLLGEDEAVQEAYGDNYRRLVELKKTWDPDNIFRSNHNIEPTG